MPAAQIRIIEKLLTKSEEEVVKRLCTRYNSHYRAGIKKVYVKQMERLGRKAIKLLRVYFDDPKMETQPRVIKINTERETRKEFKSARSVSSWMDEAVPVVRPAYHKELGALLYRHAGEHEFQDLAYEDKSEDVCKFCQIDQLCNSIDKIYEDEKLCRKAHRHAKRREIPLLRSLTQDKAKDYLREEKSTPRIKCVLGGKSGEERPYFLGAKIYNPVIALNRLKRRRRKTWCKVGPVHGDLHPKNIIFSSPGQPHLIDFAWSHRQRPILVDYVLFENSLRFLCFPKIVNPQEQLEIDRQLIREKGYRQILNNRLFSITPKEKRELYRRLALMVQKIRDNAKRHGGNGYNFHEYLLTQFIVLYGLLRIDEYLTPINVRALGLIAKWLFDKPSSRTSGE